MKMKQTIGIIGGDRRQAELAGLLAQDGHPVRTYGLEEWLPESGCALEQAAAAEVVILPLPLCREPGILNCCGRRQHILWGRMILQHFVLIAQKCRILFVQYMTSL